MELKLLCTNPLDRAGSACLTGHQDFSDPGDCPWVIFKHVARPGMAHYRQSHLCSAPGHWLPVLLPYRPFVVSVKTGRTGIDRGDSRLLR